MAGELVDTTGCMTDSAASSSRRDGVIVAQRFIAGKRVIPTNQSPVGTQEACPPAQSSLRDSLSPAHQPPAMNRWAILGRPSGAAAARTFTNRSPGASGSNASRLRSNPRGARLRSVPNGRTVNGDG